MATRKAADQWAAHPLMDYIAPVVAVVAWWRLGSGYVPADIEMRIAIHAGVAVLSGLVLTAATFICALTYQSANILLEGVRRRYASELRRNWFSVIMGAFWMAVVPLVALGVDQVSSFWALAMSIGALALLAARAMRSAMWLQLTLFAQEATDREPEVFDVAQATAGRRERRVGAGR